jgi:hypothetical protein
MSYIGNSPTQSAFVTDLFNGTGSTTAFTMSVSPANPASILVSVSGVLQSPDTYSISGQTLNFSAAPPSATGNISVRYLGIPASGVTTTAYRTLTEFTATAGQTTFTPPSYTVGFISVYRNGVMLGAADYTATNGTSVVLASGASVNDLVVTESFYVSSVLNAIPNTAGSVSSINIQTGVSLTTPNLGTPSAINLTNATALPWVALPTGSVLQVVQSTYSTETSTTSGFPTYVDTGLSGTITPKYSTSKILVIAQVASVAKNGASDVFMRLVRNGSSIMVVGAGWIGYTGTTAYNGIGGVPLNYLDSPATTSATTYKVQFLSETGGQTSWVQGSNTTSTLILMEIAA